MNTRTRTLALCIVALAPAIANAAVQLVPLGETQQWQRAEWRIDGLPETANNFDPDIIRVTAAFTAPSGRTLAIPAFWYQEHTRALVDGAQVLTPSAPPEWRLRFTPDEAGEYSLELSIVIDGDTALKPASATFSFAPAAGDAPRGWIRVGADERYLATSDGTPLRLIGANVCWGGARATYNFDDWFAAMADAGENFARLWFAPWSMGIEHKPGTLNRYDLAEAWQADYVVELAEEHGINFLIAMDHHGMFMANDPAWGGSNNFWLRASPYSVENGGPCKSPDVFFTSETARRLYQKRLRYMIARWGWSTRMVSWQFFNEIDNAFIPRSDLVHEHVVEWHRAMGRWLRAHDPYGHLVSTSLTGASDRPDFWNMPELDFAVYHSYGEADPALYVARLSDDFVRRYDKPVMIGEFGTDFRHWNIAADPYLRGFRQGLWGGTLGGSMGTSMSWWWEGLHADNVYPLYVVLRGVMRRAGWRSGAWEPAKVIGGGAPPMILGEPAADAEPFNAPIQLNQLRLNPVSGEAAIASPLAADRAAERISSYLHGTRNPQLQQHARLAAWFGNNARLVFRVNSVAADADLLVRIDGTEVLREPLVNKDGLASLNDEIDREFAVAVPAGKHTVEIAHTGADWVNLKSARLERVLPAPLEGGWNFGVGAIVLRSEKSAVVYVRSPHVAWPAGALQFHPPAIDGATVTIADWPAGPCNVEWIDPRTGEAGPSDEVDATGGVLTLLVPGFNEDWVGIVTR
ncbi:MAG TPA: DUF5060 domain-containing protein [Opitutaceae bacterium]